MDPFDTTASPFKEPPKPLLKKRKNDFRVGLKQIMYGFGDEKEPDEESVELLGTYVEEFMKNLVIQAYNRSLKAGYSKMRIADIMHQIKDNEKMFMRAYKLLTTLDSVEKARKRQGIDSFFELAQYADKNKKNVKKKAVQKESVN